MGPIDDIKDRLDIVGVIGESVKLRKSGKNFVGFCPFHPNTRTPAFVVFPDSGTWRCFGACNEGGDIFKFVMKKEGWDFPETLRQLAVRAGVELKPRSPQQEAAEEASSRLRELLEAAVTFYRHNLNETSDGAPVLSYLHLRGLADGALESFEVGYAPAAWDACTNHLRDRGYTREEMVQAGIVSERESGGVFDRFRNRVMLPIRDPQGRMAGFGARVVNPEDSPKFLNSPQSALFDKGGLLYGLDKARKAIRSADRVVLVEGYMDVIALHQAGFANVVSPMGTALSEQQLRMLKRFTRNMILALDADAAGDTATLRGLSVARGALDRQADPVFDARGLVRHEGRLDADLRIVSLPAGQDPDEVVASGREAWENLLGGALTVVDYVLAVMTSKRDVDDPKAKAEIARQMLPLIEDVADPVEREAYRQNLARRLKVDERTLQGLRPTPARSRRGRPGRTSADEGEDAEVGARTSAAPLESFCMGVLLSDPELLYRIDRQLQSLSEGRLAGEDFTGTERQVIFNAIRSALAQDEEEPARQVILSLDEPLAELAQVLQRAVADLSFDRPDVIEEVMSNFLRLRKRNLESNLTTLQMQVQTAQEEAEHSQEGLAANIKGLLERVNQARDQKRRLEGALARRLGAADVPAVGQGLMG
jgi:DNA primase